MCLFGRLEKEHWNEILGVLIIIFAIWMLVSLLGYGGKVGDQLKDNLGYWIGYASYLLNVIIIYWGVNFSIGIKRGILSGILGSICLMISGLLLLGLIPAAGKLGETLNNVSIRWIGTPGLLLAGSVFLILGVVLSAEMTFSTLFRAACARLKRKKEPSAAKKRKIAEELSRFPKPEVIISGNLQYFGMLLINIG